MFRDYEKYKGIHPGAVIGRELEKRQIKQRPFALSISEHPQNLNAITKGKRDLNTALALKIEEALDLEEGIIMMLQIFYDIRKEKEKHKSARPNMDVIRKRLFWDTDIDRIDWQKQYKAVIKRVFERGNKEEKREIIRFYGGPKVESVVGSADDEYRLPLSMNPKDRM